MMRNISQVAKQIETLARLGIHFSVDDFGTGYSSLAHLHQLPVQTLKIDRSFVERINEPNGTYSIVQAIVFLAHSLGLIVVAEERGGRRDQLTRLWQLECDRVQGYYFARPMPASADCPPHERTEAYPGGVDKHRQGTGDRVPKQPSSQKYGRRSDGQSKQLFQRQHDDSPVRLKAAAGSCLCCRQGLVWSDIGRRKQVSRCCKALLQEITFLIDLGIDLVRDSVVSLIFLKANIVRG